VIAVLRLALADAVARRALILGAALLVAAPVTGFLLLDGLTRTVDESFTIVSETDLIVQETNSVGEFLGSRIPDSIADDLLELGVSFAIPEIHTVTGTAPDTAVLLRGVDPLRYRSISTFEMVSGAALSPDDPTRSAMVGVDLAASRGLSVGDQIAIRGRPFDIIGLFEVGTYSDHEAWVTISDAREILGWDAEVSLFVIPAGGPLSEGDTLPGSLTVVARGAFAEINDEWDPIIGLTRLAAISLAVAASIVLAAVLWRMAWLRRRDLAVLRAVGMNRWVSAAFLSIQAAAVAVPGIAIGVGAALLAGRFVVIESFGIQGHPEFDLIVILRSMAVALSIVVAALAAATARAIRARPAALLRRW